jgi:hypothetical protein
MIIKSLLIIYPIHSDKGKYCLTYRKRGSYFSLIEHLSQFYISILTIRPWIHFIMDNKYEYLLFSSFLLFFYSLIKLYNLYKALLQLRCSINEAVQTLPFPSASINELRENMCPICQSEYQDPIVLTCKVCIFNEIFFLNDILIIFSIYFVKNVYHHGLIEMLHVHFVDVNYL